MRNPVLVIVLLVIAVVAYYVVQRSSKPELPSVPEQTVTENATVNSAPQQPQIKFPVKETSPAAAGSEQEPEVPPPLPALDQSDQAVQAALADLYNPQQLDKLFSFDAIIRHIVVTVDNMTAGKLPQKYKVNRLPADKFLVKQDASGELYIDPANYNRYTPYIRLLEAIDTAALAEVYFRFYPLFQQAYEELGYPDRYFNDRLVQVIDHVLASPDVQGPIALKQPVVYYTFADPELEKLSAGRKLMIRIGPDNAARVKDWLRRLRAELSSNSVRSEE